MTEKRKLKKGDCVVLHTCIESEECPGKIWTCKTDQFTRGTGNLAQDSVFLEGYSGSFAPEFLQKVVLPSEDEGLLATLEETEQQLVRKTDELTEAQQTIARLTNYLEELRDVTSSEIIESQITNVLKEALGEGAKESC